MTMIYGVPTLMEYSDNAVLFRFCAEQGYAPDFSDARLHHEIYLSDPRRGDPAKLKTVIRHPIRRA